MAPIPELAGRREAPPMELVRPLELFGRKEIRSQRIFIIANTFLRKPTCDIITYSAFGGDFAQTPKRIFAFQLPFRFRIPIEWPLLILYIKVVRKLSLLGFLMAVLGIS